MSGRVLEWLLVVSISGLIAGATFGMAAQPLKPLSMLSLSFWITAIVIFAAGVLSSLVLVDLKRAFLSVPASAVLAAVFYGSALMAPAATMSHYTNHLWNYTLVQSVPVVVITLVLSAFGVLAGTFINTSVREYDL